MFKTALIAIENALLSYDKLYSYYIPPALEDKCGLGCRVKIPFGKGNRKIIGVILKIETIGDNKGLKPVLQSLDSEPVIDDEGLFLISCIKEHTFCSYYDAFKLLYPAGLNFKKNIVYSAKSADTAGLCEKQAEIYGFLIDSPKSVPEERLFARFNLDESDKDLLLLLEGGFIEKSELLKQKILDDKICMVRLLTEDIPPGLTARQKEAVKFLLENGEMSLKELCYYKSMTRSVADNLYKKGFIEYYDTINFRNPYSGAEIEDDNIVLSPEQEEALNFLDKKRKEEKPVPALLYGITGSGKTKVFLSLIKRVTAEGKTVIVMVPEISLASQTVKAFHQIFGSDVAVLHSGLSMGERTDEWKRIKNGEVKIVVGTRSAVFAPLKNIGLIVMDEEQEHTYHSEKTPRYHARDIARARCSYNGALLLLSSATPSIESYYNASAGKYSLAVLSERYGNAVLPDVYIVDMKDNANIGDSSVLSMQLMEEIRYNLESGEQVILLLNRRGYASQLRCPDCGHIEQCPGCSVSMVYHKANDSLVCHYCGYQKKVNSTCSKCGNKVVTFSGIGTQKVTEDLEKFYPSARILRVDMDTTSQKFSHERLFSSFLDKDYDIMIGTQMVAKGLNFPSVTLVGVLMADQSLYAEDFRSFEKSFSLLTQVLGRSGRAEKKGRAFIQTYSPENPVIMHAASQDYTAFYTDEIKMRNISLYPPFSNLACFGLSGPDEGQVLYSARSFLTKLAEISRRSYPDIPLRVLGPSPADTPKISGKYRYKIIIKCRNNKNTRSLFREALVWFYENIKNVSIIPDMYYDRF